MAEGDDTGNGFIHEIFQKVIHFGSPTGAIYGEKHEADTPATIVEPSTKDVN